MIYENKHSSSMISSSKYDDELEYLQITFNDGGVYEYYNYPKSSYARFMKAKSVGKFFITYIRDEYDWSKIS